MSLPGVAPPSPSISRSPAPTVLLIEDDPAVAEVIAAALEVRGHVIEVARSGGAALERVSAAEPDVVVLDLGLPDIDGIDVCRQLRRWFTNPIVVLTADGDELRKIEALDAGADDYVTKPYSMPELLARLRVALRHRGVLAGRLEGSTVAIGDLVVDTLGHVATVDGESLRLARKEFALLVLLAGNCGRVLTHTFLLSRVWGTTDLAKTEALRGHVLQLRKKLGTGPRRPRIATEAGVGYRLVLPGDGP